MKKNLLFYFFVIVSLILSYNYVCLKEKCDDLKIKTQGLQTTRLQFENLNVRNKQLQDAFNTCCLPREQTISLMEGLIDQNTWDGFAHDWCLAPEEIKTRFCNAQNRFYQGHLSFFSFPDEVSSCMQRLLQLPTWPFAISIKRRFTFNPILQITIEYFFVSSNKLVKTNS